MIVKFTTTIKVDDLQGYYRCYKYKDLDDAEDLFSDEFILDVVNEIKQELPTVIEVHIVSAELYGKLGDITGLEQRIKCIQR